MNQATRQVANCALLASIAIWCELNISDFIVFNVEQSPLERSNTTNKHNGLLSQRLFQYESATGNSDCGRNPRSENTQIVNTCLPAQALIVHGYNNLHLIALPRSNQSSHVVKGHAPPRKSNQSGHVIAGHAPPRNAVWWRGWLDAVIA